MKVLNDLLEYNNLKIYQDTKMFNFSLDTVLLARFIRLTNRVKHIIDIGTNNGAIPLILSCYTKNLIYGIEIQEKAARLASENVKINNLSEQIIIEHQDIKVFSNMKRDHKFDLVISNPPFFKLNEAKLNSSEELSSARHETFLSLEELISSVRKIIENKGYFVFVHRVARLTEIFALLKEYDFAIKRIKFIHSYYDSSAANVLIEARFQGNDGLIVEEPIIVHCQNGDYTEEVKRLFKK